MHIYINRGETEGERERERDRETERQRDRGERERKLCIRKCVSVNSGWYLYINMHLCM